MTGSPLLVTPHKTGARLGVRVVPRASRTAIAGVRDGRLLVRVTAPPVDQAATDAALALLAQALGVPGRAVRLVAGAAARNKVVEITGLAADEILKKLNRHFNPTISD